MFSGGTISYGYKVVNKKVVSNENEKKDFTVYFIMPTKKYFRY